MPLWQIYTPEHAYSKEDKQEIAEAITSFYDKVVHLPRFYVVVIFEERPADTIWVGGEAANRFVRIVVDHIARHTSNEAERDFAMAALEKLLAPYVKDRGYDWEIHCDETPKDLWRVQGLTPPPSGSAAEKQWALDNEPTP
ncbi:MAG: tautomerase family protein [Solirubrobacteraceae bacterium]